MKKFGLLLVGGISAIVLLNTIGPMIGLLIGLALLYFIFKKMAKTESTAVKIGLGLIGFIILISTIHLIPAIIGVLAAYVLYLVYKKWNEDRHITVKADNDPFVSFEKQWNELNNK